MKRYLSILIYIFMSLHNALAQDALMDKVLEYYKKVPQEKLFVHTDKDYYVPGDTVWFRAHMVDGATNRPVCRSKYVYVELLSNRSDELVRRIMVKADADSVFANIIPLSSELETGNYTLVAYTQWMRNFEEDLFFRKQLHVVGNKDSVAFVGQDMKRTISLSVFPEGGNLISGCHQRLAYKAMDSNGKGIDVNVVLKDKDGNLLQEGKSQHLGMGSLYVYPQYNEELSLTAFTSNGDSCKVILPPALEQGATLMVEQRKGFLYVKILHTPDINMSKFSLVVYGAGTLVTQDLSKHKSDIVLIDMKDLSTGVVNVALVDGRQRVWAERLVFVGG